MAAVSQEMRVRRKGKGRSNFVRGTEIGGDLFSFSPHGPARELKQGCDKKKKTGENGIPAIKRHIYVIKRRKRCHLLFSRKGYS